MPVFPASGSPAVAETALIGKAATVAELAAYTPINNDILAYVNGVGLFRFIAGYTGPVNSETAIAATGGAWLMEAASTDALLAYLEPEFEVLQDQIDAILVNPSILSAEFRWTSGNISIDGGIATINVAVPGAKIGYPASLCPMEDPGNILRFFVLTAIVTANGVITARITNPGKTTTGVTNHLFRVVAFKIF